MRTKLILFVLLLAGLLFLMNRLGGRYLSSLVDQQLQQIAATDDQLEYRYQALRINPALGTLTIKKLGYRDHQTLLEANEVRGYLTWADMWRVLRHGSDNPLSQIHSFRIAATSLSVHSTNRTAVNSAKPDEIKPGFSNPESAFSEFANLKSQNQESLNPGSFISARPGYDLPEITIQKLNLLYNGRMDELLELSRNNRLPNFNHRFNLSLSHVTAQNGASAFINALPVLSGYVLPDTFDRISFQVRYRADKKIAQLSTFRIQSPDLTFRAGGEIQYEEALGWPYQPESYSINYQLNAVTHDIARINLPGILGGFSMDTLSVTSQLRFDRESVTTSRHPLAIPGATSLYLGDIYWYPSAKMTARYSLLFGMFGLSEKQLPVRSLRSTYHISQDTLRIDNATIFTDPFDARIHMLLSTPSNQQPNIQNGSVTFIRTGTDFNEFVDGLENLFQIELPRKDGRLYFEFSGDPGSPQFNFDL